MVEGAEAGAVEVDGEHELEPQPVFRMMRRSGGRRTGRSDLLRALRYYALTADSEYGTSLALTRGLWFGATCFHP